MKRTILALLASATLANAGLTGEQMKEVMALTNEWGFVFVGPRDLSEIDTDGKPIIERVMVFYRASDGCFACFSPKCATALAALGEFNGSKLMWELNHQFHLGKAE